MDRDPYETAIDQILQGADGDVRLALRTVLIQNLQLEARLQTLAQRLSTFADLDEAGKGTLN